MAKTPVRERTIEEGVKKHGRRTGWWVSKFSSPATRGVPDDIFIKDGKILFIEFKAPGKKPTKLQASIHRKMEKAGASVYIIDDIGDGKRLLDFHDPNNGLEIAP